MKEEFNKDIEKSQKKNQTEIMEINSPLNQILKVQLKAIPTD
jgi:hypothetical protein